MKPDSPLFDRIRVKPGEDRRLRPGMRACANPNCREEGAYRAPMGRGREGEFIWFCLDHVREYNAGYNYFAGMNDAAVAAYQKDAITGHRPTWGVGVNAWGREGRKPDPVYRRGPSGVEDPFDILGDPGARRARSDRPEPEARPIRNAERKALSALGLDVGANAEEIKARFKELAKRFHPDANGGDRSREDRLREIIDAYNYLKSAGAC